MSNKTYTMADLINDYGFGFEKIEQEKKERQKQELIEKINLQFEESLRKLSLEISEEQRKQITEQIVAEKQKENSNDKSVEQMVVAELKQIQRALPKDITIKCKKCGIEFVWTIKDQEYYKEKGFFKPSSCKECRKNTKVINNFHKIGE